MLVLIAFFAGAATGVCAMCALFLGCRKADEEYENRQAAG